MITAEKRRVEATAKAIADQPGLPDQVSAELSRELAIIGVGTDETRATFVQKADQAWRIFNINIQNNDNNKKTSHKIESRRTEIIDRICSIYRELINLQGEFNNLFEDEHPNQEIRGSYFIEVIEPIIEGIELERNELRNLLDGWRWLNPPRPSRKRVGRPPRSGPELGFAADLAAAWQESFEQPAGVGSEARFMRVYSPLCGQLGLRALRGPKLARVFKFRSKLFGKRLGAEQRGRPKKNNLKNPAKPF